MNEIEGRLILPCFGSSSVVLSPQGSSHGCSKSRSSDDHGKKKLSHGQEDRRGRPSILFLSRCVMCDCKNKYAHLQSPVFLGAQLLISTGAREFCFTDGSKCLSSNTNGSENNYAKT
jgi:hypothetical protein